MVFPLIPIQFFDEWWRRLMNPVRLRLCPGDTFLFHYSPVFCSSVSYDLWIPLFSHIQTLLQVIIKFLWWWIYCIHTCIFCPIRHCQNCLDIHLPWSHFPYLCKVVIVIQSSQTTNTHFWYLSTSTAISPFQTLPVEYNSSHITAVLHDQVFSRYFYIACSRVSSSKRLSRSGPQWLFLPLRDQSALLSFIPYCPCLDCYQNSIPWCDPLLGAQSVMWSPLNHALLRSKKQNPWTPFNCFKVVFVHLYP